MNQEDEINRNKMTKCITHNCHYMAANNLGRGLCMRCYSKAKEHVESGAVTWDDLVAMGLALSTEDAGVDPFTVGLNKKMEGK